MGCIYIDNGFGDMEYDIFGVLCIVRTKEGNIIPISKSLIRPDKVYSQTSEFDFISPIDILSATNSESTPGIIVMELDTHKVWYVADYTTFNDKGDIELNPGHYRLVKDNKFGENKVHICEAISFWVYNALAGVNDSNLALVNTAWYIDHVKGLRDFTSGTIAKAKPIMRRGGLAKAYFDKQAKELTSTFTKLLMEIDPALTQAANQFSLTAKLGETMDGVLVHGVYCVDIDGNHVPYMDGLVIKSVLGTELDYLDLRELYSVVGKGVVRVIVDDYFTPIGSTFIPDFKTNYLKKTIIPLGCSVEYEVELTKPSKEVLETQYDRWRN